MKSYSLQNSIYRGGGGDQRWHDEVVDGEKLVGMVK